MLRSRFFWRSYSVYGLLIVLSAAVVGGLIARRMEQKGASEVQEALKSRAILLAELARPFLERAAQGSPPASDLQDRIRTLGAQSRTRLTVIRADGTVEADSEKDPSQMDNHAGRPEILAALSHGYGMATRLSDTTGERMTYFALPLVEAGLRLGYVRTSVPWPTVTQYLTELRAPVVVGATVWAAVALLLGMVLAWRLTQPLALVREAADRMAEGDYSQRLDVAREDEMGRLAQAFNRIAANWNQRMETIETDRRRLLTILTGMVEGVVAVDALERVVHMNQVAGDILRTSPAESVARPIWEVTRVQEACEVLSTTLQRRRESRAELRLPGPRQDQTVEMQASPLQDAEGRSVGAVLVLHDVSELHRLEQIRRDFVANVSHELKTPIAAIRGLVETLIDDREMAPENRDRFLAKMRGQTLRLSSIVSDLLTLSRLDSGHEQLDYRPFDLSRAVREMAQSLLPIAEEKEIQVDVQTPEGVTISGDETALSQVIGNLLDNALKYTPRGGQVWVRLKKEPTSAVMEVQDTGVGIDPGDQRRIFERFYRVDKARSRELGSTGLGLAIVKHTVRAHGGEISLTSTPGIGSTFQVILPLTEKS